MTQTNVQRPMRRLLKEALKQSAPPRITVASSGVGATAGAGSPYEWQFKDEHGTWIRYGSPNTDGDLSCVTSTTSDDIERHFWAGTLGGALRIESNSHQYVLDFQAMTQTNLATSVQRPIRRVWRPAGESIEKNIVKPVVKRSGIGVAVNAPYEWQFQDKRGAWIRYGSPSSGGDLLCVTTTSSDDIEGHYANNPNSGPLSIQSNSHQYLLDFLTMTQTNQTTTSQRPIRRVVAPAAPYGRSPATSPRPYKTFSGGIFRPQSATAYEWLFLDQNSRWISYGQPNSLNQTDCVTSDSSDDIERRYQQNPSQCIDIASQKHQYRLDFATMTQTNKKTGAVRQICRRPTTQQGLNASGHYPGIIGHSSSSPDSVPSNWSSMAPSSSAWTAVPLGAMDPEYIKHIGIIKQAVPHFNVRRMFRVQNPFLWKAYVNKKNYMSKQHPGIRFREEHLYHGTDPKNVTAICEENIDWRLHGSSHGQRQGRGAYFARSPKLAAAYAGQPGVMFVVKVLVGHTTMGDADIIKPPKDQSGQPYDTTVDNEANPTIFVKYDTQEYYPDYYVEF